MHYSTTILGANLAFAIGNPYGSGWNLKNFKTLVTFGDSYTDENRLAYFGSHNGQAPPVGWDGGVGYVTSTGGLIWPRYASIYSGVKLYNYAVSGAVCSNQITPRTWSSINAPFPDIAGYELPAFIADSKSVNASTGKKFFTGTPKNTAYAIWIGTNDIGNNAFLTDSQVPGKTLKDYLDCMYGVVDGLYKNGGRNFVLLNLAPLQLVPQYAIPQNGGLAGTKYYPSDGRNVTETSWKMYEYINTVNQVYKYRTPFGAEVEGRWHGAKIANFDVNALMTDIYNQPGNYLNGTAPLNVTGVINQCDENGKNCHVAANKDSYLWYDELHPSEQTDRIIAREFLGVLGGRSKWAAYWSS